MIMIRKAQMTVFSQAEIKKFEERVVTHLRCVDGGENEAGRQGRIRNPLTEVFKCRETTWLKLLLPSGSGAALAQYGSGRLQI